MKYVMGVDLGTSSVKVMLVDQSGKVIADDTQSYPLIQKKSGYSEQDPEEWVIKTKIAINNLVIKSRVDIEEIEGMSFSGQMHGLVLLNKEGEVLRPAILWNDTRTTAQCRLIEEKLADTLLKIAKNKALEGFTLPKILWVKENEPQIYNEVRTFLLPKDYLRYRLTGELNMDYSDAAGTLLLNIDDKTWSRTILSMFNINLDICPPLVESHAYVGHLLPDAATDLSLSPRTKVFAGGADNACGALGAGITSEGKTMCSIGTSGVVLTYELDSKKDFSGKVHYFNHAMEDSYYAMGVTLSAGHSLNWFRDAFSKGQDFNKLLLEAEKTTVGSGGLLFTPYLVGERTPYADANIRASFIGVDSSQTIAHFSRAILEGITFSLRESLDIFRENGQDIDTLVSIGGGAKSEFWLQMQADIFNASVQTLEVEQGPGLGAAILAAYGCGWYDTLDECSKVFTKIAKTYDPLPERVIQYNQLYLIYKKVYQHTMELSDDLKLFRELGEDNDTFCRE